MRETEPSCDPTSAQHLPLPRLIYQYRRIDDHLFDTLTNKQIWVANPNRFNDPFDVRQPSFTRMSQHDIECFTQEICKDPRVSEKTRTAARDSAAKGQVYSSDQLEKKQDAQIGKTGVACFCEVRDNILMWSHYADKHSGVSLCFDTRQSPFHAIQRVNYVAECPKITPWELVDRKTSLDAYRKLLLYKSCDWAYEREWRLFISSRFQHDLDRTRAIHFKPEALRRIIFGCRTNDSARQRVFEVLNHWPSKIHFYLAEDHPTKFELIMKRLS